MNKVIDYPSKQMREDMKKVYNQCLLAMLTAWQAVQTNDLAGQNDLEMEGKIEPGERKIDAKAEYENNILKITVNNVLPRRKNDVPGSLLRYYWTQNIVRSLDSLDVHYDRALCIMQVFGPRDVGWDVDNRAVNYIINALAQAGVIAGDEWYRLSLLLLGGMDRERPRTEITLVRYDEEAINNLVKSG